MCGAGVRVAVDKFLRGVRVRPRGGIGGKESKAFRPGNMAACKCFMTCTHFEEL